MSDKSPKKLDRLFQQGSEQYDFDYNAEAWQQMDALLEQDDRRRRFFWWWFAGLAILVLAVAFLFLQNNIAETSPSESMIQNSTQSISQKESSEKNQKKSQLENQNNTDLNQNSNKENTIPNSKHNKTSHQKESKNSNSSSIKENKNSIPKENKTNSPPPLAATTFKKVNGEKQVLPSEESSTKIIVQDNTNQQNKTGLDNKTNPENILLKPIPTLPLAILDNDFESLINFTLPLKDLSEDELNEVEKKGKSELSDKNALLFGLLIGTELTSVGMGNFSKISWKLGAHFEYRFMKKFSTSLGANFIKKNYEAGEGEYIPPKGFWTRTIAPQSTLGACKIVEVPLIFGYYPKGFSNSGFYFNAGVNSYFMLWEWYDYFYDVPDPDLIKGWGTEENSQYWFGIGQFSVGYNYLIGRKTSLQIEPYLQFPLTGVGHGNVKLWSLGINLKANLNLCR